MMKKRIENVLFPVAFVMGCLGVLIASGVLLALVFAVAVKAQDGDRRDVRWATKRFCAHYSWDGSCSRYRYERRRVHVHQHYQPEHVRYYTAPREWDGDDRGRQQQCREVRKAVGDQHLTVDGAKKQANEAWAAAVRFHHGEKFIDLANAACGLHLLPLIHQRSWHGRHDARPAVQQVRAGSCALQSGASAR